MNGYFGSLTYTSEPPSTTHPPPTTHPRTHPVQYSNAAVRKAIHLTGEQQPIRWLQCPRAGRGLYLFTIPRHAGGQASRPREAISALPPRRGGAPTPVLSPARRSAAVRMGRGGNARPPEAEWSSGVAVWGGVITKIFSKIQKNITITTLAYYILRNKGM